jgi:dTDP-4-amino-4,6-dideoxygalactose transaminase
MRDGQHAGSWAHAAVCSVGFPGVSSAVEGGVIVTADEDLFQRMVQQTQPIERQRRDCPSRMCNEFIMNMTMNPSSAVIAYFAFEEAKRQIKYRQEQATALLQALISDGLCVTPLPAGGIEPSYHTVTFEPAQGVTIPDLRDWLIRHGLYFEPSRPTVDKLLYQLRNYQLMAHRKGWPPAEACPVAERQNRVRICLAESAGNGKLRHNSGP